MKSEMTNILGLAEMLNEELNQIDNGDCYIGEYKNLKKMEKEVRKIMEYISERKGICLEMNVEEYEEEINEMKNELKEDLEEELNYIIFKTMSEALFFILKNAKEDFKAKSKEEKRNFLTFIIPYTTIIEKMNYDFKRFLIVSFINKGDK